MPCTATVAMIPANTLPKFDLWKNFGNQAVTDSKDQRKYDVRNHNRINNMLRKGIYRTGWIYPKIIS